MWAAKARFPGARWRESRGGEARIRNGRKPVLCPLESGPVVDLASFIQR
jgi:hypothetical protein